MVAPSDAAIRPSVSLSVCPMPWLKTVHYMAIWLVTIQNANMREAEPTGQRGRTAAGSRISFRRHRDDTLFVLVVQCDWAL